jgi:protein-tyrosine phosphatase
MFRLRCEDLKLEHAITCWGAVLTTPLINQPANWRDVGGLALAGGGVTRSGVLYRGDALYPADEVPLTLPGWPPAVVVDLRSEGERQRGGVFPWPPATSAHHVPLMRDAAPQVLSRPLGDLYRHTLEGSGQFIAEAAGIVAAGPALVQCTAGKDRTGLVIAVILLAVGVEPGQVVADYTATAANMPGVLPRMAAGLSWDMPPFEELPPMLREAPADAIATVIDILSAIPGGAAGWLVTNGLSAASLDLLRSRLGGAG